MSHSDTNKDTSQEATFIQPISGNKAIAPNDRPSKRPDDDYVVNIDVTGILIHYASILAYVEHVLSPRLQVTLFIVLAAIFETTEWWLLERQAVKKEEFEISAVVWALKIGPKGLVMGRSMGKSELETLLAAEEAWISANHDAVDYDEGKKALL
ncbi:hypothetical protein G6011_05971 [Alternaria panax]|uniref:Uncharacterized protein n=1 Tax=Alternaria panax TaxID=48097 RepID=A0AAD4I7P6_9PLEO|nr:hypothetical protein G6011_05971 [Alternaria panax]